MFPPTHSPIRRCKIAVLLGLFLLLPVVWGCQREDVNARTSEFGDVDERAKPETSTTDGLPSGTGSGNATESGGTGTGLSGGGLMNNTNSSSPSSNQ